MARRSPLSPNAISWCALAIAPALKRWWAKLLALTYPLLTLLCIVVTGNHYLLDAVGGAVCLGAGYAARYQHPAWLIAWPFSRALAPTA